MSCRCLFVDAPGSVPAMPLRDALVASVLVLCLLCADSLVAAFANIQRGQHGSIDEATQRNRIAHRVREECGVLSPVRARCRLNICFSSKNL